MSFRRSWLSSTSISRRTTSLTRASSCSAVGRAPTAGAGVTAHTASRKVLLGMVPVSTQTPPTYRFFLDHGDPLAQLRRLDGARWPAGPLLIATRSNS